MIRARERALVLASALTSALGGCGYSSRRLIEERGISSIAIQQFDNATYRRDLEFRLTRALAEEVRARTSWRIETPARADAILRGTIRSAETRVLAEAADRTKIAERLRIAVDVELVERATGRVLRQYVVAARQEYTAGRFGETLEGSVTDVVATSLALEIVAGLERPIGGGESVPLPKPARGTSTR